MRLSDVVSNLSSSTTLTEIILLVFFAIFVGVGIITFFVLRPESVHYLSNLPLQDDEPKGHPHV